VTDANKTMIAVILDESGSMLTKMADVIGGFDQLVSSQRALPGTATLSLTRFSSAGCEHIDYIDRPLNDVPSLKETYQPRGSTALYDAVCSTIDQIGKRLDKLPEDQRPGKVVVVIFTDGAENDSKQFTAENVKQRIEHQRDRYSWVFTFIGADQNAIMAAASIGISAELSLSIRGLKAGTAIGCFAENLSNYRRTGNAKSMSYSTVQRDLTK
jgi:uncharacterized protein YegL